jgi:hypothetical protein
MTLHFHYHGMGCDKINILGKLFAKIFISLLFQFVGSIIFFIYCLILFSF